ncbi:MAG: hypothetical protein AB2672_20010, partial [Candidatus Thiodiazotropha endolucinida]
MNKIGYCLWLFASTLTLPLCAEERPQDWPCEQALVHEIPAAVVWAGPSIVGLEHAWEQDKEVSRLVNRFVVSDYDQDAADAEIAEFSAEQDSSEKDSRLTLLFAGVIQTLNEERKKKLDGIIKNARGQAARANRLRHELDELSQLQE